MSAAARRLSPGYLRPRILEAPRRRGEPGAAGGVASAGGTREQARRGLARAQTLATQGLLASEERERAELEASSAQRALEAADFRAQAAAHDAEVARAALAGSGSHPILLRSPVAGRAPRSAEARGA